MMKKFLSLVLAFVMILSLNVVAFAGPGTGGVGDPVIIPGPEPINCVIVCPEDGQGEDDDNQD